MLTHKYFFRTMPARQGWKDSVKCLCEGWYLFGFIRVYSRQIEFPK
jgi:hypothetical protein